MLQRKICVSTGSRADYGLLRQLMRLIKDDNNCELQIIVTGSHLEEKFGYTARVIEEDGFKVDKCINMSLFSTDSALLIQSMGSGLSGFGEAFSELRPDVLILLGDRYEALLAAQAAAISRLPIAHIHGGEATFGSMDEMFRHAITKLSHLHFVAAHEYRMRVIQMGETPNNVFNVGSPGLDEINNYDWFSKEILERRIDLDLSGDVILVTYHPATHSDERPDLAMEEILKALDNFPMVNVIFTYPSADPGAEKIIEKIEQYVNDNSHRSAIVISAGRELYLNLARIAKVILGNSSSGLIEIPFIKRPTINVGERQKGRIRALSVIDVPVDALKISSALDRVMTGRFDSFIEKTESLYGSGNSSQKILELLKGELPPVSKIFHDLEFKYDE